MPKPAPKPNRKPNPKAPMPDPMADVGTYQIRERQLCAAFPVLTVDTGMSREDIVTNISAAGLVGAFYVSGKRQRFLLAEADEKCPQTTCHHLDVTESAKEHVILRIVCDNRRNHDLMKAILEAALKADKHTVRELVLALRIATTENDSVRRHRQGR